MIYFFNQAKGFSLAEPASFLPFDNEEGGRIFLALNLGTETQITASEFRRRCSRVMRIPDPKTKSPFARSKLKDNLRQLMALCDELGNGIIAWE